MGTKAKEEQSAGTKTDSDIHVGAEVKGRRPVLPLKVILLLVLCLLVAAGLYAVHLHNKTQSSKAVQRIKTAEEQVQSIILAYNTSKTKDAATLNATEAQLAKLEASARSTVDKSIYAGAQVELYTDIGNTSAALDKALAADKAYHTAATAATMAGIYMQQANYAKAVEYYQSAADRSPKTSDPKRRSAYNDYLLMKKNAEAQL